MKNKLNILFEDEHLIIINKAARMLSIPDRFVPEKLNLKDELAKRLGAIWVVHRLDLETSGVICFAKTAAAHQHLSAQFENRSVQKNYVALLDGQLLSEQGQIDTPIARHPEGGRMMSSAKGKAALTHFQIKEKFKQFTLVNAQIETGRTHQIRVHFQSIGHPLAVDRKYGRRMAFLLSEVKKRKYNLGKDQEERPLLSRTSLHAASLQLQHPKTEEVYSFEAPLPKDLRAVIQQLRKWNKL